jgi:hypothetical protein
LAPLSWRFASVLSPPSRARIEKGRFDEQLQFSSIAVIERFLKKYRRRSGSSALPEKQFDVGEIGGDCNFGVGGEDVDEFYFLPDKFAGGGVVGDLVVFFAELAQGAAYDFDSEGLGGLDGP